ncbi:pentatricopeptide repeat-containing protein [Citrus sinensis]|uniref:Pentatricopeptide repeat-containing protein n=1 Tax=Citrus sinensis TaxID=2711 RepID=A0ACB8NZX3_CITSI|nr:pentatricopeptide repeat-containing protein [Citrus sinensis]
MPAAEKLLSSLFRSSRKVSAAVERTSNKLTSRAASSDFPLKQFVSAIDTAKEAAAASLSPSATANSIINSSAKPPKPTSSPAEDPADDDPFWELGPEPDPVPNPNCDNSLKQLSEEIQSLLVADDSDTSSDSIGSNNKNLLDVLQMPWLSTRSNNDNSLLRRREIWRERKQKWVFSNGQTRRFSRIVKICANQLGTEATFEVFGKMGRENGVKEHNSLIGICIEKARACDDEDVAVEQICRAFQIFNSMKEKGFRLEEVTYGPLLTYFIDMGMIEEFHFFCNTINNGDSSSVPRLGYYEMLLWMKVNDEEKIRELCKQTAAEEDGNYLCFQENYLLALCESDRKIDILQLLETIDIRKISLLDHLASIFKSLGRLLLESDAEKYILAFKTSDDGAKNASYLIVSYVTGIPNLEVEDIFSKFKGMHAKLEITPSSASYKKLITYSCDLMKVHVALDVVEQMVQGELVPSTETINSILHACEESYEFNLVRRIYPMICHHNLKPNSETFRSMISLNVKIKDFDSAYSLLDDLKEMNLMPTASMYNAIMAGYFRKKDVQGALMVLKEMEQANVKPDSQTFSYLIHNCSNEEDITKYYEQLKSAGGQITKYVFMALINAYTTCGEFEKARQVVLDAEIPVKSRSEVKSALVSALASHGRTSDAIIVYEEIKEAGCNLEPRAVIALIEHLNSEGELNRLIQLLEEVHDPDYWMDGCCRLILHCVRFKQLSSATDLLKQLKDKFKDDEMAMEYHFSEIFCQIATTDPPDVQIGLDLLQFIKDELGLPPSRKCLDFLLGACVNARDLKRAHLIWKEYENAGLPYNVLSYLWMYKAFLASGNHKSASKLLSKMPKDDPHVRFVIQACKQTYTIPSLQKERGFEKDRDTLLLHKERR